MDGCIGFLVLFFFAVAVYPLWRVGEWVLGKMKEAKK
jgi:hypothetical protein